MKQILVTGLALITLNVFAQKQEKKLEFTPEQIATLKSKRIALSLNLDESQQQRLYNLNFKRAQQRKSKSNITKTKDEPSAEERYILANQKLDKALTFKKEMRSILNEEQYKKWQYEKRRRNVKQKHSKRRKMLMKRKRMRQTRRTD